MRVTVTQFSDTVPEYEWAALIEQAAAESTELVVLGEMPFARWPAATNRVAPAEWQEAVDLHDARIARLGELPGVAVAGSRPVLLAGVPHNEGSSGLLPMATAHPSEVLPAQ